MDSSHGPARSERTQGEKKSSLRILKSGQKEKKYRRKAKRIQTLRGGRDAPFVKRKESRETSEEEMAKLEVRERGKAIYPNHPVRMETEYQQHQRGEREQMTVRKKEEGFIRGRDNRTRDEAPHTFFNRKLEWYSGTYLPAPRGKS